MAKNEKAAPEMEAVTAVEQRERKWLKPSKRAAGYAEERKKGVHMRGPKRVKSWTVITRACARGTCWRSRTTQACISTKRQWTQAQPSRKRKRTLKRLASPAARGFGRDL